MWRLASHSTSNPRKRADVTMSFYDLVMDAAKLQLPKPSAPPTAFCCRFISLPRNICLVFECMPYFNVFILSFIETENACQSIHKCPLPLDSKLSLAIHRPKMNWHVHLVFFFFSHVFLVLWVHTFLILYFILYPSSYSGFRKDTYKVFNQSSRD